MIRLSSTTAAALLGRKCEERGEPDVQRSAGIQQGEPIPNPVGGEGADLPGEALLCLHEEGGRQGDCCKFSFNN